jgi:ParB family chromosome partitioning protein
MKRLALGKGLEALIPGATDAGEKNVTSDSAGQGAILEIPIDKISASPFQSRRAFDPGKLAELAESIKERGVIQPVVVRPVNDTYELIAGERRLRAVQKLGWSAIPAVIIETADKETAIELALIENLQREDLNPIEEASGYHRLITECNLSQSDVAARVGKDRSSVANAVRLLSLPDELQKMLIDGSLSAGHARALLAVPADSEKISLAHRAAKEDLSVRHLERLVYADRTIRRQRSPRQRPAQIASLEESLKRKLATRVTITQRRKGGKITIEYYSVDELNRLLEFFGVMESF